MNSKQTMPSAHVRTAENATKSDFLQLHLQILARAYLVFFLIQQFEEPVKTV